MLEPHTLWTALARDFPPHVMNFWLNLWGLPLNINFGFWQFSLYLVLGQTPLPCQISSFYGVGKYPRNFGDIQKICSSKGFYYRIMVGMRLACIFGRIFALIGAFKSSTNEKREIPAQDAESANESCRPWGVDEGVWCEFKNLNLVRFVIHKNVPHRNLLQQPVHASASHQSNLSIVTEPSAPVFSLNIFLLKQEPMHCSHLENTL